MNALDCIEEESARRLRKTLRVPQVGKGDWMVFFDTPQEFGFPDGTVRMVTELGPYTDRSEAARKLHLAGCTGRVRKAAPGVYRSEFGESKPRELKRFHADVVKPAKENPTCGYECYPNDPMRAALVDQLGILDLSMAELYTMRQTQPLNTFELEVVNDQIEWLREREGDPLPDDIEESRSKRIIMQVLKQARERESVSDPNWTREGLPWQVIILPHGREPRVYGYCQSLAEGERMLRRMRMPGYVARMRRGSRVAVQT